MADRVTAYIGLGANLDHPRRQILDALDELEQLEGCANLRPSSLYASPPMGPPDQPDYINAVAEMECSLPPEALLDALQSLESRHGRVRKQHWGPRTLDLDLLLYGEQRIDTPRLTIPHPGIGERAFVLLPLAELMGEEWWIPGVGRLGECFGRVDLQGVRRLQG
jgi:2-amino-4-hydroxy-6-hydroxymethyldihydropteridine diphosphokinase